MTYACLDTNSRWPHSGLSAQLRRSLALATLVPLMLVAVNALGQMTDLHPTATEIVRLPQFCWSQMGVPNATGPEFSFPFNCGSGLNHYCPGLVQLIRAKGPASKGKPIPFLRRAAGDIIYTENAIKDFPNCSIRDHVAASKAEVDRLLMMYGAKRTGAR